MTTTSTDRAEANRRNAQKSCGPKTATGKDRSRFNAVKHGMRARQPILPGEDPDALSARLDAWTAQLEPRDDVDRFLVGRAVDFSWQLERAGRARAARLADAATDGVARLADSADEVLALGRRLFWDPLGPLPLYPHLGNGPGKHFVRVSWSEAIDDPNEPARVMNRLESTAMGCAWLLDCWGELRARLENGWTWQPPERLRAIRMLGQQPMDAVDDDRVMAIYLACWAMQPDLPHGFSDLSNELSPAERVLFLERLDDRLAMARRPKDAEAGKAQLLAIIAVEEERLELVLELHLDRDAPIDAAPLFDDSEAGERLRRYEATCDRGLLRVLAALRQRRRDGEAAARAASPAHVRAAGRAPRDDAGDRAARVAGLLSALVAAGSMTNGASGGASGEGRSASAPDRDEVVNRTQPLLDPGPSPLAPAEDPTNEANGLLAGASDEGRGMSGPTKDEVAGHSRPFLAPRPSPLTPAEAVTNEASDASGATDDGHRGATNEARAASGATHNGQRTRDHGQRAVLALRVLLFIAGLTAAVAAPVKAGGPGSSSPSGEWPVSRGQWPVRTDQSLFPGRRPPAPGHAATSGEAAPSSMAIARGVRYRPGRDSRTRPPVISGEALR